MTLTLMREGGPPLCPPDAFGMRSCLWAGVSPAGAALRHQVESSAFWPAVLASAAVVAAGVGSRRCRSYVAAGLDRAVAGPDDVAADAPAYSSASH